MLIEGIYVPLTAPFYRDGASYWKKLEHNVARYSMTPAAGLVALTTESGALNDAESAETLSVIAGAAAKEKVLVASIAKGSVRGTLAVAEQASAAGFDAVLLTAPPYWRRMSAVERMLFFRAVADVSPLPVLLGSESSPGCLLSVAEIAELAAHSNVIGLLDALLKVERLHAIQAATVTVKREVTVTTVFGHVTRRMMASVSEGAATFVSAESLGGGAAVAVAAPKPAIKTRTKTVGFQVISAGTTTGMVDLLEAGVAGAMPTLAACAPQGCYEAYAAFKDGDPALAAEKEQRLAGADNLLQREGVAAVKYGCDLNGYFGGVPRLPRLPLNAEKRAELESALQTLRN